ncbi:hypothetical protein [Deinococcus sonorensis]|uniref:Lipocalin-like domain-containing protein n=2 Tax=Deinococcus sonorensis TaxID=309891 RepID=A0AAU7UD99_9DEIO
MKYLLLSALILTTACAPSMTSGSASTYVNAPSGPVQPGQQWTLTGTTPQGDKFSNKLTLDKVSPDRSESGLYTYDADQGFVEWNENGYLSAWYQDPLTRKMYVCITYNGTVSSSGPYGAYLISGTSSEVDALFRRYGNTAALYAVLGNANACTLSHS